MFTIEEMTATVSTWLSKATPEERNKFLSTPKEKLVKYHDSLGRDIRNEFKLWDRNWTPVLDEFGCDASPDHPDQLSMKVIEEVWKERNKG